MPHYCFIPGSHPALSLAELQSAVSGTFEVSKDYFVLKTANEINPKEMQFRLGGTVKIASVVETIQLGQLPLFFDINNLLGTYLAQSEDKIVFGVSIYGKKDKHLIKQLHRIGLQAKKELHENSFKARFVFNETGVLSSVTVTKNHLIERGAEIIILNDGEKLQIGKTLTVQDFEEYSKRDYGRPSRDPKRGILPPKIAQIMINLAEQKSDSLLLDPFCGTGTILQEALRLGFKNLIGSDISKQAIDDTEKNLNWYTTQSGTKNTVQLYQKDVQNLLEEISPGSIDAIVTEPYLGPPLSPPLNTSKIEKIISELENLYALTFKTFEQILKPNGEVVITLPYFRLEKQDRHINFLKCLYKNSLKAVRFSEDKTSLTYSRPDQIVGREIYILKK